MPGRASSPSAPEGSSTAGIEGSAECRGLLRCVPLPRSESQAATQRSVAALSRYARHSRNAAGRGGPCSLQCRRSPVLRCAPMIAAGARDPRPPRRSRRRPRVHVRARPRPRRRAPRGRRGRAARAAPGRRRVRPGRPDRRPRPLHRPRQGHVAERDRRARDARRLPLDPDGARRHRPARPRRGGQRVRRRHARRASLPASPPCARAATSGWSRPARRSGSTPGSPTTWARARWSAASARAGPAT